jgi:hypothetical protein
MQKMGCPDRGGDPRRPRYFKTVEAKKHTLADLIDRYIKSVIPSKGSQDSNQQAQLLW